MKWLWEYVDRKLSLDPLDVPLLKFSQGRLWTMRNAFEGTLVTGSIGSGKTSGAGQALAIAMLKSGFSGLVLCDMRVEPELWKRYCQQSGRSTDLVLFNTDSHRFNPLEQEKSIFNRVALLQTLLRIQTRGSSNDETFWQNEASKLLGNLLRLAEMLGQPSDLALLHDLLASVPANRAEAGSESWRQSTVCGRAVDLGARSGNEFERRAAKYFAHEFSGANERSRAVVESMVSSILNTLLQEGISHLFTGRSTITPEKITAEGRILVVDLPLEHFRERGAFANQIWKHCFQRSILDRADRSPTFLWADEAQNFVDTGDDKFQATCRSSCCATVFLTQNYPGLVERLGTTAADKLVGNLNTQIFHRNQCAKTRQWASEQVGRRMRQKQSETIAPGESGRIVSQTTHLDREPIFQPEKFNGLSSGGERSGYLVEAIVLYPRGPFNESFARLERFHQQKSGTKATARVLG